MRRFEELKPVRARTLALRAVLDDHAHDRRERARSTASTADMLYDQQMEIIVLLSGVDETLADRIYARHSYTPDDILWDQRFVDVLSVIAAGPPDRRSDAFPRHRAASTTRA